MQSRYRTESSVARPTDRDSKGEDSQYPLNSSGERKADSGSRMRNHAPATTGCDKRGAGKDSAACGASLASPALLHFGDAVTGGHPILMWATLNGKLLHTCSSTLRRGGDRSTARTKCLPKYLASASPRTASRSISSTPRYHFGQNVAPHNSLQQDRCVSAVAAEASVAPASYRTGDYFTPQTIRPTVHRISNTSMPTMHP